ncbi:hypothetical protein KJI95_00565 [Shewanella sp. JM162201]|uniref:Flagellar hook-length control protein FliK n=1 Tax=Shewanella jiangmenensis TaxID=2837387 RepID=A0ABS5UY84_9GAMM|nr:hypothetical protein [Shewanella jiangmenensis]
MPTDQTSLSGASSVTLLGLGQSSSMALPQAFIKLIHNKGLAASQLMALARQGSGYLLGEAIVNQQQLKFASLPALPLPKNLPLPPGRYRARITVVDGGLTLTLDKIECELQARAADAAMDPDHSGSNESSANLNSASPSETLSSTKRQDMILQSLQRKLLGPLSAPDSVANIKASLPEPEAAKSATPPVADADAEKLHADKGSRLSESTQLNSNVPINKSAQQRLGEALARTGAMLEEEITAEEIPVTPASAELAGLMALLQPLPVSALMAPGRLKEAMLSAANPNLLPLNGDTPDTVQSRPLALLFQLLMGLMGKQGSLKPGLLLGIWSAALMRRANLKFPGELVQKGAELAKDVSLLSQSRLELLQASRDSDGWYFCLPYLLSDKQQSFEGHWQNSPATPDEAKPLRWQLSLRFNLTDAELLVKARRYPDHLALQLISSNAAMTGRIANFVPVLSKHLAALGFENPQINALTDRVPPSLLPNGFEPLTIEV